MNIYQKMSEIAAQIPVVVKRLEVGEGRWKYKAVSEVDILEAVKPIEKTYGVFSYPMSRKIIDNGFMENKQGSKSLYIRMETVYRFVNMDNPEEHIDIVSYGDGVDTMDKAPGKAMTYCDKYAIMKAYKISTGDDPDADASSPQATVSVKVRKEEADAIEKSLLEMGANTAKILRYYKVASVHDLTQDQAKEVRDWIKKTQNGA